MENKTQDVLDETLAGDTPEDVAVLYSWANLQGAKYRDFSASRREYRAAMRHRAAEEQRQAAAAAQAEAERAAAEAERAAREAEEAARFHETAARRAAAGQQLIDREAVEAARARAMRHAEELSRIAAAERLEAARRAEAVAAAEASARREVREMEDARISAQRQAERYAESEQRRRVRSGPQPVVAVPGQISDPYSSAQAMLPGRIYHQPAVPEKTDRPSRHSRRHHIQSGDRVIVPPVDPEHPHAPGEREYLATGNILQDAEIAARGAQAIAEAADRHDHVRHLYSEPDTVETRAAVSEYARQVRSELPARREYGDKAAEASAIASFSSASVPVARPLPLVSEAPALKPIRAEVPVAPPVERGARRPHITNGILGLDLDIDEDDAPLAPAPVFVQPEPLPIPVAPAVASPSPLELTPSPGQRAYAAARAEAAAKAEAAQAKLEARRIRGYAPDEESGFFRAYGSARAQAVAPAPVSPVEAPLPVPAWLDESSVRLDAVRPAEPQRKVAGVSPASSPTVPAESLQRSRERVAARWYALKGILDHGLQEQQVDEEARSSAEQHVPLVAVFSLAGGVGKTSLVATMGRALSAMGEKVLLTDTTSHGLLPFYFGASELHPGVMRTFSPPSGSADAPICLLSYDVLQKSGDQVSQDWFATEIEAKSQGMARVILDLSSATPWVVRRLAKMDAVMLVPLSPDMNSVISLGAMEAFFASMKNAAGKTMEPFYVLNQFDSAQALHLDVREVMRQQLGDRLLPFVIRRATSVPESLAEGMTVMDYAPDSPAAEDYRNLAAWLKARSAPALVASQPARWSER